MNARIFTALAAAVLVVASVPPAGAAQLARCVVGGGAVPAAGSSGSNRRMLGTVGQGAIGLSDVGVNDLSHGYWRSGAAAVVGVAPQPVGGDGLPSVLAFGAPWPNPARGHASFRLDLPKAATVRLTLHDVQGRVVDRMEARSLEAGRHTLKWDVRGGSVAAGAYFARLDVDGRVAGVRRVVLVK